MGKYKIYIDNTYPSSTLSETGIVTAPKRNTSGDVKLKKVNASQTRSFYINGSLTRNLNPINIKSKLPAGIQGRMNSIENYIGESRWSYIEGGTGNLNNGRTRWGSFL